MKCFPSPGKQLSLVFMTVAGILLSSCISIVTPPPHPTATAEPSPISEETIVWFPPTATPVLQSTRNTTPTPDFRDTIGDPVVEDDFSDPEFWNLAASNYGSVAVANQHLTLTVTSSNVLLYTFRSEPLIGDLYLEVTANPTLCRGEDEYGILIRSGASGDQYRFSVSCSGKVKLTRFYKNVPNDLVPWAYSGVIPGAVPANVKLGVLAIGSNLRFYANGYELLQVDDTALENGQIGFYVKAQGESGMTVNFYNLKVYSLKEIEP